MPRRSIWQSEGPEHAFWLSTLASNPRACPSFGARGTSERMSKTAARYSAPSKVLTCVRPSRMTAVHPLTLDGFLGTSRRRLRSSAPPQRSRLLKHRTPKTMSIKVGTTAAHYSAPSKGVLACVRLSRMTAVRPFTLDGFLGTSRRLRSSAPPQTPRLLKHRTPEAMSIKVGTQ